MRTVYKYPLLINDEVAIEMPTKAKVRLVGMQEGKACLWVEVDTDHELETRHFYIFGTGHAIPYNRKHVASFQDRVYVWHIYE